jgi:hypothetical protein
MNSREEQRGKKRAEHFSLYLDSEEMKGSFMERRTTEQIEG